MLVKVCGMRDPENIKGLLEQAQPDLMGMIFFEKSSRFVGQAEVEQLSGMDVPKVGVFVNAGIPDILEKVSAYQLAYVQLHGDEDVAFVQSLAQQTTAKIIKVFRVEDQVDWDKLKAYAPFVTYFLFDTQTKKYGGSGKKFDWSVLEEYPLEKPFILSGGIDEESAGKLKEFAERASMLAGVDINSKFEKEPGLKDIEKIQRFVTALRA